MNADTHTPTPETDAFAFSEERRCHESGALMAPGDTEWLDFARTLERQRDAARQQALDMAAQVLALREALEPHFCNVQRKLIEADLRGVPNTAILRHPDYINAKAALSDPPPPVVPLAEHQAKLQQVKVANLEFAKKCFIAGCESAGDDVTYHYAERRWQESLLKVDLETECPHQFQSEKPQT